MRSRDIYLFLAALAACDKRPQAVERLSIPDHTTSSHCDETSVRQEVRVFLRENVPGSRLTIMPVACTSDMVEITDQFMVPARWGSGAAQKRRAWMEAELQHLENLRLPRRASFASCPRPGPCRTCSASVCSGPWPPWPPARSARSLGIPDPPGRGICSSGAAA